MRWMVVLLGVLAVACTTDKWGSGDAGIYYQDGATPVDKDLSGSFVLEIPEGTWLCSGFHEGRSWEEELSMQSMMELAAGTYVLEREERKVRTEGFIKRVLFSPEKIEVLPKSGMGMMEVSGYVGRDQEEWGYTFTMPMRMEGKEAEAVFGIWFTRELGDWPEEITFDLCWPDMVIGAEFWIAPGEDYRTELQGFGRCGYSYPPERMITATGANGDVIKLKVEQGGSFRLCICSGHTRCLLLTEAEVDVGGYAETITDHWRLVYNGSHHNWRDKYLIFLGQPVGEVHAVLVIGEYIGWDEVVEPEFVYMDAEYNEVGRETEVTWECVENPLW